MNFIDVSDSFFFLGDERLSLEGRGHWLSILADMVSKRRVVLACGRQVEKTTNLLKFALYRAATVPGNAALYVAPRLDQLYRLERSRLRPLLESSPVIRKILADRGGQRIKHLCFRNGSQLFLAAALGSADSIRGLSVSDLFLDEFQDLAIDTLNVAEECQSHARDAHTIIAGTSKLADNPLERAFERSTGNLWWVSCPGCGKQVQANGEIIHPSGYACPGCQHPLDLTAGRWVAANPDSTWAAGYRINQLMGCWTTPAQILEKQRTYEPAVFANEVLGEPVDLGDLVFDLQHLLTLCTDRPMAAQRADVPSAHRPYLVGGVDWGHVRRSETVLVIGALMPDYSYHVHHWRRWKPGQDPQQLAREVAERCQLLGVQVVGADGIGHGQVLNALLLSHFRNPVSLIAVCYSDGNSTSCTGETSARFRLSVPKSRAVGGLVSRATARQIHFPRRQDVEPYLVEMCSELCRQDEKTGRLIYEKAAGRPDDALHALVYAVTAAQQAFFKQAVY